MKALYAILSILLLSLFVSCKQQEVNVLKPEIIPAPKSMEISDGSFVLPQHLHIAVDDNSKDVAALYVDFLKNNLLCETHIVKGGAEIKLLTAEMEAEAYKIRVGKLGITIEAADNAGFFYALQSLIQFFPDEVYTQKEYKEYHLPLCTIEDAPRFAYRGVHLDVCRHFFPVDFIKKYIDVMAKYKMNRFHWHLTEDQGWRIEIKAFPKLQEISSMRIEEDGAAYGGYYTQEQVKEIVAYAAKKGITIIPEIELPGHARAALAAYPEYSCSGEQLPVANTWGVFDHVYCAGNEETFAFLQAVLDEVIELFPSEYIHIGGDECPKGAWEKCKKCQDRMKAEGLADEHELQSYFVKRIEKYLNSKGKKLIGWDEILEGGLAPDATVMSWRGVDGGIAAAKQGHYAIMTPGTHCYFDHYQARKEFEPKAICCYSPLKKVYHYEPIPAALSDEEAKYILGAQANMWTEYMHTSDHVEMMLLPRMLALSEVVWSAKEKRNYDDFNARLQVHRAILAQLGYNVSKGDFSVDILQEGAENSESYTIHMSSEQFEAEIRYTLDGTVPTKESTLYAEPFEVKIGTKIKAGVFVDGQLVRGETSYMVE